MDISHFYTEILGIKNERILKSLVMITRVKLIEKGTILHNIGDIATEIDFLDYGLLRGYFQDAKGAEMTDCFIFQTGAPAMASHELGEPTVIAMEALEDSSVISISLQGLLPLIQTEIELVEVYNRLLQESLRMHWETKVALTQCAAQERYKWFLEHYPSVIDRVSHKHVASFLGITPVSLSRVRSTVKQTYLKSDKLI